MNNNEQESEAEMNRQDWPESSLQSYASSIHGTHFQASQALKKVLRDRASLQAEIDLLKSEKRQMFDGFAEAVLEQVESRMSSLPVHADGSRWDGESMPWAIKRHGVFQCRWVTFDGVWSSACKNEFGQDNYSDVPFCQTYPTREQAEQAAKGGG